MNITADNYEAYLLDYIEGKLSHEEAAVLHAFIVSQGLDWDELTEAMPHLKAPQIEFKNKQRLKKKSVVVPLYVKMASAAAVTGLLLTIGLWPEKQRPKVESVAELKPIEPHLTVTETPIRIMPRKTVHYADAQLISKESKTMLERIAVESVAPLLPLKHQEPLAKADADYALQSTIDLLRHRMEAEQAFTQLDYEPSFEEEMPTSFIGRTIYRWSQGRYSSINDLVNAGLTHSKQEIAGVTTEIAMEMQQRTEEYFADAREYWKSIREE